ncbi:hypothetical protein GRS96_08600 [Rathayibacter sp. VKM Ac-2803]|uniref:hypothetical protein n=1 Tax=unclassified Rathayibacter TaxID=2609250 RepID=UPI00135CF5DD|nr:MULTISPECIES: hypothetical protein [unclassified Rathayibacter]MWV49335.1 hypothetical protein [Rathayibacter sp. VKM Ac-2803]MWV59915.1 hypothetical protein [Rathayibacter sp. VKM Ac-2754]
MLEAWSDADAAQWVSRGSTSGGLTVRQLVPATYPAFARVLHSVAPETWSSLAARAGVPMSPTVQWEHIDLSLEGEPSGLAPRVGFLLLDDARRLSAVLKEQTTTPHSCWFGLWEGWADSVPPREAARFTWSLRGLALFHGAVEDVVGFAGERTPAVWWPEDRSWFVVTEVDYDSTVVGGTQECIDAVIGSGLEALPLGPDDDLVLR